MEFGVNFNNFLKLSLFWSFYNKTPKLDAQPALAQLLQCEPFSTEIEATGQRKFRAQPLGILWKVRNTGYAIITSTRTHRETTVAPGVWAGI